MKLALATTDGGAGKTATAFALAKELDHYLISNDDSVIEKVYPGMAKITKTPKVMEDTVYDFGGFTEAGVIDIIKHCDLVIVPCINDINSKMKAIKTIQELSNYNSNFLVLATRLENEKEFTEVKEAIHKQFKDIPVLPLRKTKMFKNGLEYGSSPLELIADSKQLAHAGRSFIPEYKAVLKHIINDEKFYNNLLKEKAQGEQ